MRKPRRGTTQHPDFIGPKMTRRFSDMLKARVRYTTVLAVKNTLRPCHPLFIGPRLTKQQRASINGKTWRQKFPERVRANNRENWAKNKDAYAVKSREYRIENRAELSRKAAARKKERRKRDPDFAIRCSIRSTINSALRKQLALKSGNTGRLLGCSIDELRAHLGSMFQDGMTWENHSATTWHIDHIIPCAAFDLTDPDQQAMCFHYTNLRPLWARDNLAKGDRITPEAIALIREKIKAVETDGPIYIERAG